jgi:hypothetical protein
VSVRCPLNPRFRTCCTAANGQNAAGGMLRNLPQALLRQARGISYFVYIGFAYTGGVYVLNFRLRPTRKMSPE